MPKNNDTRDILALFAGILGFFLIWSGYSNFLTLKFYDITNVIAPVVIGLVILGFVYKELRD